MNPGLCTLQVFSIGVMQLVCLAVYLIPRTSLVGAVLWTGYLGGAIASQVRVGNPLFTHVLFPIYVAGLLWGGLYLRDSRVGVMLAAAPRERR
jgi:DoxX-like family